MTEQEQRDAVVREAMTWMGTPFHMGQRLKGSGVDCGWFLIECYKAAGCRVPERVPHFPFDWHHHTHEEKYLEVLKPFVRPVEVPQRGDIAMFRFRVTEPLAHSAVIVAWPLCIHAVDLRIAKHGVQYVNATQGLLGRLKVEFYSPFGE